MGNTICHFANSSQFELKGIGVSYDLRHAEIEAGTQSLFQLQLNVTQDLNPNYELRVYDDVKALAILEDFDMELARIYEKEPLGTQLTTLPLRDKNIPHRNLVSK